MNWLNEFKSDWIRRGLTPEAITYANKFGEYLQKRKLSSSQLRNVFGEMKQIEWQLKKVGTKDIYHRYLLLYPKLAYAAGRQSSEALNDFKKVFEKAYSTITNENEFQEYYQNLLAFVESTLAFHKAFGGK